MPARPTNHSGQARQRVYGRPLGRHDQPFTSYQRENARDEDGKGGQVFEGGVLYSDLREN